MKKQFELCGKKLETLYIEEELLDKLDMFSVTIRLMGYKINSSDRRISTMWEKIFFNFISDMYKVHMEIKTYGYDLDYVKFEIYYMNRIVKSFTYDRKKKKELECLYEMLDEVLVYI